MADNTTTVTPPGSTNADVIRDIDRGGFGVKTQVVQLDVGGAGASESLVSSGNPLPISAAALPLPAGAATAAGLTTINTTLGTPLQAGGNVAVTNFPATQPVSVAAAVTVAQATAANLNATVTGTVTTTPPAHASTNVDQVGGAAVTLGAKTSANSIPVVLASDEAALPVTGTFWQATQPVSGNVGVTGSVAVTGTFWQATQPVSGNVGITGSVAVTGTFWQATQPVSGTVTANQGGAPWTVAPDGTVWTKTGTSANVNLTNASVAVTGTFWQATQPVSAASLPLPAGAATSALQTTINTTLGTPMQQTGGTVAAVTAITNPVTVAQATAANLNATVTGTVTANQGTANTAANAWFAKITDGTNTGAVKAASTAAVAADPALVVAVSPNNTVGITVPTLTKGTQGATGLSVQSLIDAGRNTRIFMLDAFTAAPVVEAVQSVVQWYGNAAVAATTQPAVVPTGKTLRLTGYKIMYQSLATVGCAVVRVRANTAGLGVLASPLVYSFEAGSGAGATTTAMTGGMTVETGSFPDGLELPAGTGVAFSMAGYGPTGTLTLEGTTRFAVYGFEY